MLTGKIVTWSRRGFGFIERDDGEDDIFVHCRALLDRSRESLPLGTRVHFEIGVDRHNGKPRAVNVVELNAAHGGHRPLPGEAAQALFRDA